MATYTAWNGTDTGHVQVRIQQNGTRPRAGAQLYPIPEGDSYLWPAMGQYDVPTTLRWAAQKANDLGLIMRVRIDPDVEWQPSWGLLERDG